MAIVKGNSILNNIRGKVGNQFVVKNVRGVTVLAMLPKKSSKEPNTAQLNQRRKFRLAANWAKHVLKDPETLEYFTKKSRQIPKTKGRKSPYVLAMTNYLKPPELDEIDATNYKGKVGDEIKVVVFAKFEVKCVKIKLTDAAGILLEEGVCTEKPDEVFWIYSASVAVANRKGVIITAVAMDLPGHTGEMAVTL